VGTSAGDGGGLSSIRSWLERCGGGWSACSVNRNTRRPALSAARGGGPLFFLLTARRCADERYLGLGTATCFPFYFQQVYVDGPLIRNPHLGAGGARGFAATGGSARWRIHYGPGVRHLRTSNSQWGNRKTTGSIPTWFVDELPHRTGNQATTCKLEAGVNILLDVLKEKAPPVFCRRSAHLWCRGLPARVSGARLHRLVPSSPSTSTSSWNSGVGVSG